MYEYKGKVDEVFTRQVTHQVVCHFRTYALLTLVLAHHKVRVEGTGAGVVGYHCAQEGDHSEEERGEHWSKGTVFPGCDSVSETPELGSLLRCGIFASAYHYTL